MKTNDTIEAALKRRPSNEREYDEPLRALTALAITPELVRPQVRVSRSRAPRLLPRLAVVALVLLVGAGVVGSLALRNIGPTDSTPVGTGPTPVGTGTTPGRLVGCWGQAPGFDPSALAGTGTAEGDATPAAAVLRNYLSSPYGEGYPLQGWHVVSSAADVVEYLAPDPGSSGWVQVLVKRGISGTAAVGEWSVATSGSCILQTVPPDGYGTATWALDPNYSVTAAATELHILVSETACHSAEAPAAESIRADVAYAGTSIVVTVSALLPEGPQRCPTSQPAAYAVHLNEPLGERSLFDGGPWPAVLISGAPSPTPSLTPAPRTPIVATEKVTDSCHSASCNWTIDIDRPVVSRPETSALMNGQIDVAVNAWIAEFKAALGEDVENERSLTATYTVALASPSLLSLRFALDEDTGGVFTVPHGLNFRVADGKLIALPDLFADQAGALALLSSESRRLLPDVLSGRAGAPLSSADMSWIQSGTEPVMNNFGRAWVFTPEGLEITFETAQVAGKWAGTPTIAIPWADLAGVIDPRGPAGEFVGAAPTPDAGRTFTVYRVLHGDTAIGIAAKYGLSLEQLLAANPQISDPAQITVGQVIYIPWQDWVPPSG
jgi:hypothetical protein